MRTVKNYIFPSVARFYTASQVLALNLVIPNSQLYIDGCQPKLVNMLFSSSVDGKYEIKKNDVVLATLFSNKYSRSAPYHFDITLDSPEDIVEVVVINQSEYSADFYLSYEVRT